MLGELKVLERFLCDICAHLCHRCFHSFLFQLFSHRSHRSPVAQCSPHNDSVIAEGPRSLPRDPSSTEACYLFSLKTNACCTTCDTFVFPICAGRNFIRGNADFTAAVKAGFEDSRTLNERSEERRVGKECRSRWSPEQ